MVGSVCGGAVFGYLTKRINVKKKFSFLLSVSCFMTSVTFVAANLAYYS